jgi:hypothetical protein
MKKNEQVGYRSYFCLSINRLRNDNAGNKPLFPAIFPDRLHAVLAYVNSWNFSDHVTFSRDRLRRKLAK